MGASAIHRGNQGKLEERFCHYYLGSAYPLTPFKVAFLPFLLSEPDTCSCRNQNMLAHDWLSLRTPWTPWQCNLHQKGWMQMLVEVGVPPLLLSGAVWWALPHANSARPPRRLLAEGRPRPGLSRNRCFLNRTQARGP